MDFNLSQAFPALEVFASSAPPASASTSASSDGPADLLSDVSAPAACKPMGREINAMTEEELDRFYGVVEYNEQLEAQTATGDLLLFRSTHARSVKIRKITKSSYGHVGIVVRDPPPRVLQAYGYPPDRRGVYVVESNEWSVKGRQGAGVHLIPLQWKLVLYNHTYGPDVLIVWRRLVVDDPTRRGLSADDAERTLLWDWLVDTEELLYETRGSERIKAMFAKNLSEHFDTVFCSEYAAATLQHVGLVPRPPADKGRMSMLVHRSNRRLLANNYMPRDFTSNQRPSGDDVPTIGCHYARELRLRVCRHRDPAARSVWPLDAQTLRLFTAPCAELLLSRCHAAVQLTPLDCQPAQLAATAAALAAYQPPPASSQALLWPLFTAVASLSTFDRLRLAAVLSTDLLTSGYFGAPLDEAVHIVDALRTSARAAQPDLPDSSADLLLFALAQHLARPVAELRSLFDQQSRTLPVANVVAAHAAVLLPPLSSRHAVDSWLLDQSAVTAPLAAWPDDLATRSPVLFPAAAFICLRLLQLRVHCPALIVDRE